MRVLVTGSRNWPGPEGIWRVLDKLAAECVENVLYVRHGGCPDGADLFAHMWAQAHPMVLPGRVYVVEEVCRAPWDVIGRQAGYWRNDWMTHNAYVDQCRAFISPCIKPNCDQPKPHNSHGVAHCIESAVNCKIPVWRYYA